MVRIWPPQGAGLCGQRARHVYISAPPWPVFYFGLRVKGAGMGVRRSRESESGVWSRKKGRDKKRYQSFRGLAYICPRAGRPLSVADGVVIDRRARKRGSFCVACVRVCVQPSYADAGGRRRSRVQTHIRWRQQNCRCDKLDFHHKYHSSRTLQQFWRSNVKIGAMCDIPCFHGSMPPHSKWHQFCCFNGSISSARIRQ